MASEADALREDSSAGETISLYSNVYRTLAAAGRLFQTQRG